MELSLDDAAARLGVHAATLRRHILAEERSNELDWARKEPGPRGTRWVVNLDEAALALKKEVRRGTSPLEVLGAIERQRLLGDVEAERTRADHLQDAMNNLYREIERLWDLANRCEAARNDTAAALEAERTYWRERIAPLFFQAMETLGIEGARPPLDHPSE